MGACADVIEALLTAVENGDSHVTIDLTDDYEPPLARESSQNTRHMIKLETLDDQPALSVWDQNATAELP